jgi:transposase-like protein
MHRSSLAYQSGPLLALQRRAADMRARGALYAELVAQFGVSRETLRAWIRRANAIDAARRARDGKV